MLLPFAWTCLADSYISSVSVVAGRSVNVIEDATWYADLGKHRKVGGRYDINDPGVAGFNSDRVKTGWDWSILLFNISSCRDFKPIATELTCCSFHEGLW